MFKCLKLRIAILSSGLLMLNCLQYVKTSSKLDAEKELSRQFNSKKSEYKVDYSLTKTGVVFTIRETENTIFSVKNEVTYKDYLVADTETLRKCGFDSIRANYWNCMIVMPVASLGIGYLITIPSLIYDWTIYPFYTSFSDERKEIKEKLLTESGKEVQSSKAKLRLTNQDSKFDKTYTFKNGNLEVPFSEINVNNLWNSGSEDAATKYYFYFSILDMTGAEVVSKKVFNGVKFRDDQNFTKLSNLQYQKEKQQEYNQCSKKFGLDNVRDGYKYIYDNGMYRNEHELVVQVIIDRVCYSYKGTYGFDGCVDHFKECIGAVRYIDNENMKYNKD